jgi:hypothetical protein
MRTLLFQQTNVVISWDDRGWLYADWTGPQSLADLKAGSDQMVRLLHSKSADSVLNDNTRAEAIAGEAAEWLGRDWFPRIRRAGLQRFAWVRSPTGLTDGVIESTLAVAPPGIAHMFWTVGEAEAWLKWSSSMAMKRKSGRITLPP